MQNQRVLKIASIFMIVMLALAALPASPVSASTITVNFTSDGTTSWIAPAGVTSVTVEAWGAGGSGADRTSNGNGGGGGGGAYSIKAGIVVIPGNSYTVVVGNGSNSGATPGGDSYFIDILTVLAKGGSSAADNSATGAFGGVGTDGVGDTRYSGGKGADGALTYGGGGGSSAGTASIGADGSTSSGGTAPAGGGNGGPGRSSSQGDGSNGSTPGGGGGGAYRTSSSTRTGGSGADGKVSITYTPASPTTAGVATASAASATSINVSMPYTGDGNDNNSFTVDYKPSLSGVWVNWVTGAAHVTSPYATTITGLNASSSYDIRVTYIDGDGVSGTNPQILSNRVTQAWPVGSSSWTAPVGVTSVTVEVMGGGGRGASFSSSSGSGGGGGGGAYSWKAGIPVTPGNSYNVVVGAGSSSTAAGGDSYFIDTSTVLAKGGNSGLDNSATGALGGAALSGLGDTKYSGGAGANGSGGGGGGGSSAGTAADGTTATNNSGAIAPTGGGNGGNGRTGSSGNGSSGSVPGGGGGGAYRSSSGSASGGNGRDGFVRISYALPAFTTVGVASASAASSTSFGVAMPYLDDGNASNSYTVDYKLSAAVSWTNWVSGAGHSTSPYLTTITGLAASSSYDVRVTYSDGDGVTGDNPQTINNIPTPGEPPVTGNYACGDTTNTSLSIPKPTGVVSGDVLIVTISQHGDNAAAPTSDWTTIDARTMSSSRRLGAVLYKIAGGSEPVNYSFSLSSGVDDAVGCIVAFSDVDILTGPFDVSPGTILVADSSSVEASSITTVTGNALVIMFGMAADSGETWSGWGTGSPGSLILTELFDVQNSNGGTGTSVGVAWAAKAAPGTTGDGQATLSNSDNNGGILIALRPTSAFAATVTTQAVSSIGTTTATGNGNVTNLGSPDPTEHGVVWNTSGTPTTADNKTTDGAVAATGAFTSSMTGLVPGTLYYVRAYSTNAADTAYGNEVTFTSLQLPTVTTQAVTSIGATTATGNGDVTVLGVPNPTQHGVVWNTTGTPTTADSKTTDGAVAATGAFTSSMSGLVPGTFYHVRAYATNSAGTAYGGEVTFTTSAILTATTGAATSITTTTATLNGSVFPASVSTTVSFEYGLTSGYGTTVAAAQSPINGAVDVPVTFAVSGLTANTPYHFRVVATNGTDGTKYGDDAVFTTAAPVTISGPASLTYPNTGSYTGAGGSGSGTMSYSVGASTGCTVNASSGLVTITNAGSNSCSVTATKAADANYLANSSAPQSVTLVKGTPTLSVSNSPKTYNGSPQSATVVASVGGSVDVSSVRYNGSATIPTNANTYAITANFTPTETNNYNTLIGAAAGNFIINKATPTLAVTNTPVNWDNLPHAATLSSSVPGVTSNILTGGVASQTEVGSYVVTANFVPTDTTNYNSLTPGTATPNFVIQKATPTLTVMNTPVAFNGASQAASVQASVANSSNVTNIQYSSNSGGSWSSTAPTNGGVYWVRGNFTPSDTAHYNTLTAARTSNDFTINHMPQTITFTSAEPANPEAGQDYTPTASATSGLPVVITIHSSAALVCSMNAGVVHFDAIGTCVILANQPGDAIYDPAPTVGQDFEVEQGDQTIAFTSAAPVGAIYGGTYTPTAEATSGLEVDITVLASSADVCEINGTGLVTFTGVGNCVLAANQPGNDSYNDAPEVQQSFAIGVKTLTISAFASDKEYDGSTAASVTLSDNRLAGDVFITSYTGASFADAAIGNGKTVTVTGITISGADADNYSWNSSAITTASIVASFGPTVVADGIKFLSNNGFNIVDENETQVEEFDFIEITFHKDLIDVSSGPDFGKSVLNPLNYMLIWDHNDGHFSTSDCLNGVDPLDRSIPINSVTYSDGGGAGPFVATLTINNSLQLESNDYRLFVCGTTSITDTFGVKLRGNGTTAGTDFIRNFSVNVPGAAAVTIPSTGFAPKRATVLPVQPADQAYTALGSVWIEIPKLGITETITGIPQTGGTWNVKWLGDDVGWLQGSAFPSWSGNSVLTGHYFNAQGTAGPFRYIHTLWFGDKIIVHAWGTVYTYEVRSVQQVGPEAVTTMMKHEDSPWLTLVSCRGYLADENFQYRILVRAALINTK